MNLTKKKKNKIMIIVVSILLGVIVVTSIGVGTYLFNYAIVEKPPLSAEVQAGADVISTTFTQARANGRAWMDEMSARELNQTSYDGIELVGYYIPAAIASKKTAVLVHGHRSDARMMGDYGKFYYDQGFNVFMADNRGHGSSEGDYVGMGWLDRLDYLGWIDILMQETGEDTEFVLHGISMGAATVLMLSGEEDVPDGVKAIIADCSFTSAWDEFYYQVTEMFHIPAFPVLNIGDIETRLLAGFNFKEASAVEQVKKSNTPIFIIHGDTDSYNPTYMANEIFEAIPGEKELWLVPGAEHGMSYYMDSNAYNTKVKDFYSRYLNK